MVPAGAGREERAIPSSAEGAFLRRRIPPQLGVAAFAEVPRASILVVRERLTWRVVSVFAVALLAAVLAAQHFLASSDSAGSTGEWYALNSPYGNCARLYKDQPLQQFEFVICRRSGHPFTCWEREVGLKTLEGGFHKVELRRRRFDADCRAALASLSRSGLRP